MATTAENFPWYGLVKQGRMFSGSSAAAGFVIPIFSNTTQQFGLWNPLGNTKDFLVKSIAMTYVSTTSAAGGYCIAHLPNAPAAIGTGLAITAFTETTPIPAYGAYGSNLASSAKFGTGATLTVTAPVILRQLGLNQTVVTAATTTFGQWDSKWDFNGDLVVTPGQAIFLAGNIATLSLYAPTIVWAEVDRT